MSAEYQPNFSNYVNIRLIQISAELFISQSQPKLKKNNSAEGSENHPRDGSPDPPRTTLLTVNNGTTTARCGTDCDGAFSSVQFYTNLQFSTRIWRVKQNKICPTRCVSCSSTPKMCLRPGLRPGPCWGNLQHSPRPPSW